MLTINYLRENKDEVIERLKVKNFDASQLVQQVLDIDQERRQNQQELDAILAESNTLSKQIGILFKNGKAAEANEAKAKTGELKEKSKHLSQRASDIDDEIRKLLVEIPNLPHSSVPKGKGEDDNVEVKSGGEVPQLHKDALPHWELAKKYDIIDFELGNKLTGAGFPVYKGKGAKLQRALINFFLDKAEEVGYNEVQPPILVNEDSGFGTGQLPDKEGQMYHCQLDNFYLVPTAEVPVTNIFRDVILNAKELPVQYTAYTPCFRREAGSYGKDVRGLNRLHQFDKVEIVNVAHPDHSYEVLENMVNYVESLIKELGLPYRILKLCGGDTSFTAALTYDFEVYSAAQEKWLEVSSVSNFESYQANRLKLRFKEEGEKKAQLAHTLNGSALALPRIVAAILENYQTEVGIQVPEVLKKYLRFEQIGD
jgi:seryl-tRNA synthetase